MQTIEGKSKFLRKGKRNAINSMLITISKKENLYKYYGPELHIHFNKRI